MKNAKKRILSSIAMMLVLLTACNSPQETEPEVIIETPSEKIMVSTGEIEAQATFPVLSSSITYTIKQPDIKKTTDTSTEVVFYRDGNPIYGRITHPKGKGPFKTIIISHGLYASFGRYSAQAERYSENGYCVIEFEYQNGNPPDSYDDPEYLGDYILEEILDLYAVMDSTQYISYCDTSNIYLYGHSMGGLVASYVGTFRQREVKGLILADPSFYATDLMEFKGKQLITTDIYPFISNCRIPVLIITGTTGSFGEDPHFFDEARMSFPYCDYIVIEGASHTFSGEAGLHLVDVSVEKMQEWG